MENASNLITERKNTSPRESKNHKKMVMGGNRDGSDQRHQKNTIGGDSGGSDGCGDGDNSDEVWWRLQ